MKKDEHRRENAKRILSQGGYKKGGGVKSQAEKAVHKHEKHDHPGKRLTKLKEGGFVHGGMPKNRLDKVKRQDDKGDTYYSKGGRTKAGKTQINVIVGKDHAAAPPPQVVPRPGPVPVPQGGGQGAPGGMTPPPGARPPMKRGGKISYPIDSGSGGGKGRLEKAKAQEKKKK